MDPADQHLLTQSVRMTTVVCFAIMMSVPVYMVIAWVLVQQGSLVESGVPTSILYGLAAAAVALLLVANAVSSRIRTAAANKSTLGERLTAFRTAAIIAFAMREGVAIIGLVLTLLSGNFNWCLGFGAVAMFSMLLGWPRRTEMERLASDPATAPIG